MEKKEAVCCDAVEVHEELLKIVNEIGRASCRDRVYVSV